MPLMSRRFLLLTIAFCFLLFHCQHRDLSNRVDQQLSASDLKPYGRFVLNQTRELELISSAAHVGFSFEGNSCQIYASTPYGHNYLQYELDGVYQRRVRIDTSSQLPIVVKVPNTGKHTLWLYKATEAHTGPVVIHKITAPQVKALQRPTAPLIEFIGNSITCGAAADPSEIPCGTGQYHDQHNAYQAYGPRVARALGANYVLSSVSGIGIYRNWNSDGPTMPEVYEKADFQDQGSRQWDFKTFTPQVVSIALGTNDFSNGDGIRPRLPFDSTRFIANYVKFVGLVKTKYPDAQIALLSSPMVNGPAGQMLRSCLSAVKARVDALYPQNKPVALFFFEPMQARGCMGHPNVEDHAVLAQQLLPFFEKWMK